MIRDRGKWNVCMIGACLLIATATVDCYDPQIGNGTLGCAAGGVCPRGFSCESGRCWRSPHDAQADAGYTDAASGSERADGAAVGGAGGGTKGMGGSAGWGGGGGAAAGGGGGGAAGTAAAAGTAGHGAGGATGGAPAGRGGSTGGAGGGAAGAGGAGGGTGKKALGAPCAGAMECLSNFCADGVCCQTACLGSCEACNLPATSGVCTTLPNGAEPPASHTGCAATPQSGCGRDGKCDGQGACRYWKDVSCAPAHCDPATNIYTGQSMCDGAGLCRAGAAVSCMPFVCAGDGAACLSTCSSSSQCTSGTCNQGSCGLKPAASSCTSGSECASSFCADGVCCNETCGDSCAACDVSGHLGTCSPIPARESPHGQRAACSGSGVCAGFCDGTHTTCSLPGSETACPCGLLSGQCNGAGQCASVGSLCL